MFKNIERGLVVLLTGFMVWGCSSESEQKKAHVSANFTVADSIDATKDFSGIGLTIIHRDSANADADTLFHASTDSSGTFSGIVQFENKGQYPLLISRNETNLGRAGIILADGDSLHITGQLPNLRSTVEIKSREHNAMKKYQRLNRHYQRLAQFARAGQVTGDTLQQELLKWGDIYWEVYEDEKGTIASELSARKAIGVLQGLDNQKMMKRIRSVQDIDALSDLGATFGKNYIAESQGLNPALAYLDSLANNTEANEKRMRINMEQIKLLYDSARVKVAKDELQAFKKQYPDNESAKPWVESISYDLSYLSPGDSIPEFQFKENGKTISRDSLLGKPYILEVTRLANPLYQNQFDRTVVIHSIYKNFGLQVVTLPLDESQITINGFFEERVKAWPVADAQAFDREQLLETFNIRLIPTRFLVDSQGNIIRKYVGNEYEDVIQGIQKIIEKDNKDKEPTS